MLPQFSSTISPRPVSCQAPPGALGALPSHRSVAATDPWSIPQDIARKLLQARDALLRQDLAAAYHQLYAIADPGCRNLDAWAALETVAAYGPQTSSTLAAVSNPPRTP